MLVTQYDAPEPAPAAPPVSAGIAHVPVSMAEDDVLAAVRARAVQVLEVPSVPVCQLLRLLARTADVHHAVELGGAGGLTASWTLDGMRERGVLTSIEADPHRHQLAVSGWSEAGVSESVRGILGDPVAVMGRLREGQYNMAIVQTSATTQTLDELHRLLHPGALLVALVAADGPDIEAAITAHDGYESVTLPLDLGVILAEVVATD